MFVIRRRRRKNAVSIWKVNSGVKRKKTFYRIVSFKAAKSFTMLEIKNAKALRNGWEITLNDVCLRNKILLIYFSIHVTEWLRHFEQVRHPLYIREWNWIMFEKRLSIYSSHKICLKIYLWGRNVYIIYGLHGAEMEEQRPQDDASN